MTDEQEALLNHGNYHTTSHEGLNGPSQNNKATLSTMQALTNPEYRRATLVVMMVLAAQQFCGKSSMRNSNTKLTQGHRHQLHRHVWSVITE